MKNRQPVTIRGTTYPTHAAAAEAFGIKRTTVSAYVRIGRQDSIGLKGPMPKVRPVTIRGVTYPTIQAAAAAIGIKASTIRTLRSRGRLDQAGAIGPDRTPFPVTIRGVTYVSVKAAAKALGIRESTITTMLSRGRADAIGLGASRKHVAFRPKTKPVRIGSLYWPSQQAAAADLGCVPGTLWRKIKEGAHGWLTAKAMAFEARKIKAAAEAAAKAQRVAA